MLYSASSTQWPLLQSKTEQKFKSGLLAVSAEFIAPVDATVSLTTLDSSEGACDIYPEPSVNYDTTPFKKISATGYKLWATTSDDESIFATLADLTFHIYFLDFARNESGQRVFPLREAEVRYATKRIQILAETGVVKQAVEGGGMTGAPNHIPSLSRLLDILQVKKTWAPSEIFNFGRIYNEPLDVQHSPTATEFLSSLSSQRFTPEILEYSATYSVFYEINFGLFTEKE